MSYRAAPEQFDPDNKFNIRLHDLRLQKGLSQPEFAREISIYLKRDTPYSPAAISAWEQLGAWRRQPPLNVQRQIADYFGVSLDYIQGKTDDATTPGTPNYTPEMEIKPQLPRTEDEISHINDLSKLNVRLKALRKEKGLSQGEFAHQLSLAVGRTPEYTIAAVSSWESSGVWRKIPPYDVQIVIAKFFGVSLDYLNALTSSRIPGTSDDVIYDPKKDLYQIDLKQITQRVGTPVYVESPIYTGWALVTKNKGLIDANGDRYTDLTPFAGHISIIPHPHQIWRSAYNIHVLSRSAISALPDDTQFWVCVNSPDPASASFYDGWYKKDPSGKGVQAIIGGYFMSFDTYNVSWIAYKEPFTTD